MSERVNRPFAELLQIDCEGLDNSDTLGTDLAKLAEAGRRIAADLEERECQQQSSADGLKRS